MASGWFKVHRKALDSWIWSLPDSQFKVAFTIMALANWSNGETMSGGQIVAVRRGQLMTSLPSLAEKSRQSIQTVRTTINNLKNADFLTDESTNRFRLITIVNYASYQDSDSDDNSETNRPATGQQQASNRPLTAIEEEKKEKKEKKGKTLPQFDFGSVYQQYPQRKGKKLGMAAAKRLVKTAEDFADLSAAVDRMAAAWRGHDLQYCPQWSSFINQERWRDDQLPLPAGAKAPAPVLDFGGVGGRR